jgi:hypothetical protein
MAIPHVVRLYQWLRSKPNTPFPTLSDIAFSPIVILDAIMQSKKNQLFFMRKVAHIKHLQHIPKVEDLKLAWFDNSEDYTGLSHFIGFILEQVTKEEQQHPLQLTLNYLLIQLETATHPLEAFNTIYTAWMASNPIAAVTWYEDEATEKKLLLISQEPRLAIAKVLVEHYLQESRDLFKLVENPLGLISLFSEFYYNPQRTAAFILCLLEHPSTSDEMSEIDDKIIQSGLLHEFFLTHAGFMRSHDNPITQLYALLGKFEQAISLVNTAHLISVMTQAELHVAESAEQAGEACNTRYFESYALDGTEKRYQLKVVETHPVAFDAVPPPEHFKLFYRLFDQRFLFNLLNYYRTSHDASVKQILEYQFNHLTDDGLSDRALMQLLNVLARENQDSLLRTMAELLQEATINTLIESGSFAIFHLIPFKPLLLEKLNLELVQRYIASIKPNDNLFEQMILLRTILDQLNYRCEAFEIKVLVFDKIIGVLMNSPNLDDARLIETLRSVADAPRLKELLQEQTTQLADLLNQSIITTIASPEGLTPDTFIALVDAWHSLSRRQNTLKEISLDLASDFPLDKYAFYVNVVKAAAAAHEKAQFELKVILPEYQVAPLNLQAILSNFFPVELQNYPEDSVSDQERTLIELLASIENEMLWAQAIQLIEAPPINRVDWASKDYGGHSIIELAEKKANSLFIQYLFKKNMLNQAAVNHLLKMAIGASQWDTVKQLIHLTGDNKPSIEFVSDALVAATKSGQLEYLLRANDAPALGFFPTRPNSIRLPVEPAPLTALIVAHGEEETVKQLIKLSPSFLRALVTRTQVTDYSGRTFTDISPFQYSIWALDWHMWGMMLESLQNASSKDYAEADAIREEMLQQYKEVAETHGVDYTLGGEVIPAEHHFDLKPLINALDIYIKSLDSWDWMQLEDYWCKTVGQLHRLVPAHIAQQYCEEKIFDGNKPFNSADFSRSLLLRIFLSDTRPPWFPLSHNTRLGVHFAVYNFRGIPSISKSPGAGVVNNLEALSVLYKVGTSNFKALSEHLPILLQKRRLDLSDGVRCPQHSP